MSKASIMTEITPILSAEIRSHGSDSEQCDDSGTSSTIEEERLWSRDRVLQVAAVMYFFFYTGVLLTATGALFEYIMLYYDLNEGLASFVFPASIVGYVFAVFTLQITVRRFGWRGVAVTSPLLHVLGAVVISMGFPFLVALSGYLISGIGSGLSDSGFNAWASRLDSANIVQGFMHSAFAVGCVVGPLVTLPVTSRHLPWFTFYKFMVIFSVLEVVLLSLAFRHEGTNRLDTRGGPKNTQRSSRTRVVKLVVHCSLYYFVYIAIESTFTNWIVLFMKRVRGVDQTKAALSSSIFWLGMAAGRAGLGPVTGYFGARMTVISYILGALCTQGLFLFVSSVPVSLCLLTFNGVFMGPMFPSAIIILGQELPLQEAIAAVSVAISIGQIGGALAPLGIGVMVDRIGLRLSFDATMGLLVLLLLLWIVFSRNY